jgi:hypothetical protein
MFVKTLRVALVASVVLLSVSSLLIASQFHAPTPDKIAVRSSSPQIALSTLSVIDDRAINNDDDQSDNVSDFNDADDDDDDAAALARHRAAMSRLQALLERKPTTSDEQTAMQPSEADKPRPVASPANNAVPTSPRTTTGHRRTPPPRNTTRRNVITPIAIATTHSPLPTPSRAPVAPLFSLDRSHRHFEHSLLDRFEKLNKRAQPNTVRSFVVIIITCDCCCCCCCCCCYYHCCCDFETFCCRHSLCLFFSHRHKFWFYHPTTLANHW